MKSKKAEEYIDNAYKLLGYQCSDTYENACDISFDEALELSEKALENVMNNWIEDFSSGGILAFYKSELKKLQDDNRRKSNGIR